MASIEKLQAKIEELKLGSLLPKGSGWLSRKLWVALAAIVAVIYLAAGNVPLILSTTTTIVIWYLATSAAQGAVEHVANVWLRGKIVDALARDGKFDAADLKSATDAEIKP